jgi:hypothetical protein
VQPGVFVSLVAHPAHSRHRCGFDTYRDTVRHATPEDLGGLTGLLARLRSIAGLVERRPGVFDWRSLAFLQFHHDPNMFADVRLRDDFVHLPVNTLAQQTDLVARGERGGGAGHALSATNCA